MMPRLSGLLLGGLWLAACTALPGLDLAATEPLVTPTATPVLSATTVPTETASPGPTPEPLKVLTVCMADEPSSLYLYGPSEWAKAHVREAIAEGPIDAPGTFDRPVILESLPSLTDGSLRVVPVGLADGDAVVDALGNLTTLAKGVSVWLVDPITGLPTEAPVEYSGHGRVQVAQLQAIFRLKPGLLWSDGAPLTADDSVFSFEVASSPETPAVKYEVSRTQSYVATDATTVVWTGSPGFLDVRPQDNFWAPLPRHAYGAMTPGDMYTSPEVNRAPLGWGPFRVLEWVDGDRIVVERNPHYFRAAEGLPRLDRVVFRFVPEPSHALVQLSFADCDVATQDIRWAERWSGVLSLERRGKVAVQTVPGDRLEHVDFSLAPAPGYSGAAAGGLLRDLGLRQAFAHCIDRREIVQRVWGGRVDVPSTYLPSAHPLFVDPGAASYPFDPERGRALLEAAGWVAGEDGVRLNSGRRLTLRLALNLPADATEQSMRRRSADIVQAGLSNCGVEVTLDALDAQQMYAPWPDGTVFGRRFDLAEFAWRIGSESLCGVYLSSAVPSDANPAGTNAAGYANPSFDAACLRSLRTLDPAVRAAAEAEAQATFAQDLPAIPLYFEARALLVRPFVTGLQLEYGGGSELWNLEQVDLALPT